MFDKCFNTPLIQQLQDAFAMQADVASLIVDLKGNPYTQPSSFSQLCDMIRATPKGGKNCQYSDIEIGKKASYQTLHIQPCLSGGLWDAGVGLYVGDIHIANWLIGQVMNEAQDLGKMMLYAKSIEADPEQFSYALTQVTVMTEEQFNHTCEALHIFSSTISECTAYEKDLPLSKVETILQNKKAELTSLIQQEIELEALLSVWDMLESAAKQYQLIVPM